MAFENSQLLIAKKNAMILRSVAWSLVERVILEEEERCMWRKNLGVIAYCWFSFGDKLSIIWKKSLKLFQSLFGPLLALWMGLQPKHSYNVVAKEKATFCTVFPASKTVRLPVISPVMEKLFSWRTTKKILVFRRTWSGGTPSREGSWYWRVCWMNLVHRNQFWLTCWWLASPFDSQTMREFLWLAAQTIKSLVEDGRSEITQEHPLERKKESDRRGRR